MSLIDTARHADTDTPISGLLAGRWSPRAFDPTAELSTDELHALLEAARWAPSAYNAQPWRFIVARRGSSAFDVIVDKLTGFNQTWVPAAAAVIVNVAVVSDETGKERPTAIYDLGQAVAHLSLQAQHDGLHTHQMTGFDKEAVAEAFGLSEHELAFSIIAVGRLGDASTLPDQLREIETAPRARKALDAIVTHA
ncbi:MAG TPA: nitroreductase family protein [Candidatus Lumbricidophila sp.]|nr:nitroreductase family protein [Candidatus Lumbricidophila sp.]